MTGALGRAAARTAAIAAIGCVVLAVGCAPAKDSAGPPAKSEDEAGITNEQLAALRSIPASEPMAGPNVPEIFTLADVAAVTGVGLEDLVLETC